MTKSKKKISKNNTKQYLIKIQNTKFMRAIFRIRKLTRKEIVILLSDWIAIVLLIILPLSVIIFTNFGAAESPLDSGDSDGNIISAMGIRFSTPKIGWIDFDNSEGFDNFDLSHEFLKIFKQFEEAGECILIENKNQTEYEELLGKGDLNGYIILHEGFEFNLSVHFVAMFDVIVDSYDNFVMQDVLSVIGEAQSTFKSKFNFAGAIDINTNFVNLPTKAGTLRSYSPYFYPLLVMALPILIESQSIIGDRPKDRMILTPTNKNEVLISKFLGGAIVNSSLAVVVTVSSLILGLEIQSSPILFFFSMELTILIGVSIGVLISSLSKTSLQGFQYSLLIIIVQEILMLFITNDIFLSLFPLFSVQEIYRVSILKGESLFQNSNSLGIPYIAILGVEMSIIIVLAIIRFKNTKSMV